MNSIKVQQSADLAFNIISHVWEIHCADPEIGISTLYLLEAYFSLTVKKLSKIDKTHKKEIEFLKKSSRELMKPFIEGIEVNK